MIIRYFDALAGAGKTYALGRETIRLAQLGQKVLFVQPTRHLLDRTIAEELQPLAAGIPVRAIHGETEANVVPTIVAHFQAATAGVGEVLCITHAAFMCLPYIEQRGLWHLIIDEVPQVDVYHPLHLPETHHLITPHIILEPCGPAYGTLRMAEVTR